MLLEVCVLTRTSRRGMVLSSLGSGILWPHLMPGERFQTAKSVPIRVFALADGDL